MNILVLVLVTKVAGTFVLVAMPFLCLRGETLNRMMGTSGGTTLFRLYGIAVLALLIVYGFGLADALRGQFPYGVAVAGLVSNAGAALVLIAHGVWQRNLPVFALLSVAAIGLAMCLFFPELATSRIL